MTEILTIEGGQKDVLLRRATLKKGLYFAFFQQWLPYFSDQKIFNFLTGYGHSTPKTTGGKFFTMVYAIVGIPLGLVSCSLDTNYKDHFFGSIESVILF